MARNGGLLALGICVAGLLLSRAKHRTFRRLQAYRLREDPRAAFVGVCLRVIATAAFAAASGGRLELVSTATVVEVRNRFSKAAISTRATDVSVRVLGSVTTTRTCLGGCSVAYTRGNLVD